MVISADGDSIRRIESNLQKANIDSFTTAIESYKSQHLGQVDDIAVRKLLQAVKEHHFDKAKKIVESLDHGTLKALDFGHSLKNNDKKSADNIRKAGFKIGSKSLSHKGQPGGKLVIGLGKDAKGLDNNPVQPTSGKLYDHNDSFRDQPHGGDDHGSSIGGDGGDDHGSSIGGDGGDDHGSSIGGDGGDDHGSSIGGDGDGDQPGTHYNPLRGNRFKPRASNDPPKSFPCKPSETHEQWWKRYLQHWDREYLPTQKGADNDPVLKALAAGQVIIGTDYVYGGGHNNNRPGVTGPSPDPTCQWKINPKDIAEDGTKKIGFDCSGFVRYLTWKGLGIDPGPINTLSLPDSDAYVPTGEYDTSKLKAGDIILCDPVKLGNPPSLGYDHVVMWIGNGYYIDANQSGDTVAVTNSHWIFKNNNWEPFRMTKPSVSNIG